MLCMVKMSLKGEVGGCALNSHRNYIVDHGKSWKNHGIVYLNFCRIPVRGIRGSEKKESMKTLIRLCSIRSSLIWVFTLGLINMLHLN